MVLYVSYFGNVNTYTYNASQLNYIALIIVLIAEIAMANILHVYIRRTYCTWHYNNIIIHHLYKHVTHMFVYEKSTKFHDFETTLIKYSRVEND